MGSVLSFYVLCSLFGRSCTFFFVQIEEEGIAA